MKILLSVLLLIKIILSDVDVVPCRGDGYLEVSDADEVYKQKCFSLSYNNGNDDACCYKAGTASTSKGCFKEQTLGSSIPSGYDCQKRSVIYNNCGMAGVFEPLNSKTCTEISLVQGYCCYVEIGEDPNKNKACIRTKKLEKDVNVTTDQIDKHVRDIDINAKVSKVICKGWNLQINKLLFVLISSFIIF